MKPKNGMNKKQNTWFMLRLSADIPNKIKQPAKCCRFCGRAYMKKTNLDRHIQVCEILHESKKKTYVEEEEEIPSPKKMYQIMLEMAQKYNQLEEKVHELSKWVSKKKKKINAIEWLNEHIVPEIVYDQLIETILIHKEEDIDYLFKCSFVDTLNHIFTRNIYTQLCENKYPIIAFIQKSNVFYIYENEEEKWVEMTKEKLVKFLNRVHAKLHRVFLEWKKEHRSMIDEDEKLSLSCDKTTGKLMDVDFGQDLVLSKVRSNMFTRMKVDMKSYIEYEFEF